MSENKKKYRAIFFQTLQKKTEFIEIESEIKSRIEKKCIGKTERSILEKECNNFLTTYLLDLLFKKRVRIAISESNGEYFITMYYDNVYNQANGEDL